MCIVLLTTAHPDYALIVIDNRDEFILRPTSRPHWWQTLPKPVARSPMSSATSMPVSMPSSASASAAPSTAANSSVNSAVPTPLSTSPPKDSGVDPRLPSSALSPLHNVAAPRYLDVPRAYVVGASSTTPSDDSSSISDQAPPQPISVLSSRDLQRAEHGTWLGITKGGNFAVLTNYRETDTHDASHPIHAARSRGGMVTAWMAADPDMSLPQFVEEMLRDGGTKGVGGFSLLCGKLRRSPTTAASAAAREGMALEPLAVISNRYDCAEEVPWLARERGETLGLSNTCYGDPEKWPKIEDGKAKLDAVVAECVRESVSEEELLGRLFEVLDHDTLPRDDRFGFEEYILLLKNSIFIPPIGDQKHKSEMDEIRRSAPPRKRRGSRSGSVSSATNSPATGEDEDDSDYEDGFHEPPGEETRADNTQGFATGLYGTQRQTVMLVDWDGNVRFTERALWDAWGREVPRGKGDKTFRFKIEGWDAIESEGGK